MKFKKEKGITLVALIITIIVLLMLAMISIRLVMNGGIIDRAERGTQAYSEAEIKEKIATAYGEYQMSQYHNPISLETALEHSGLTGATATGDGPWVITVGEKSYNLALDGTVTPATSSSSGSEQGGSSTPATPASYTAYAVGDVVTLGGEDFYVIEASDASTTTVKFGC